MRPRPLLRLAVLFVLACGTRAGAEDEVRLIEGLLVPDAEVQEGAQEAWENVGEEFQATAVRAGLRSERADVGLAAAVVAVPSWLDGEDLALASKALLRDPLARFLPPEALEGVADDSHLFGSGDLPAIWRAIGEREPAEGHIPFAALHRCLRHAEVAALVPLLATAKPGAFRALLWDLMNQAQGEADDERHDVYVKAFRYALFRLAAEAEGKPAPAFEALPALPARAGLPSEFLELAQATSGPPGEGLDGADYPQDPRNPKEDSGYRRRFGPSFWMARWARRLVPAEDDVERLLELTQLPHAPDPVRLWAARHVARLDGRAAARAYTQIVGGAGAAGDVAALGAAAEAAARGRPEDWKELSGAVKGKAFEEQQGNVGLLRWIAEPERAPEAAWAELVKGDLPGELEPWDRGYNAYDLGIEIPREAVETLATRLRKGGAPPATELAFFARVMPEAMTVADAERIVERWQAAPAPPYVNDTKLLGDLAALEVRAPEGLRALLRRWASEHADPEVRSDVLGLLARLGDAESLEAMLAAWPMWNSNETMAALGRVADERVERFLRKRTADADPEIESAALEALAVRHGCPEPLARFLGPYSRDDDDPKAHHWAEAKALVLAGDPIGAVLARTVAGPEVGAGALEWTSGFALTQDPRVAERMRAWRAARGSGLTWPATAVLAVQGDPAARAEWGAFLRSARTFMLDHLQDSVLFTFNGDPAWVREWIDMLAENCCLSWHAGEVLEPLFPTAPWQQAAGDGGRACAMARAWIALHGPHLVKSRLLDGWVPGPR